MNSKYIYICDVRSEKVPKPSTVNNAKKAKPRRNLNFNKIVVIAEFHFVLFEECLGRLLGPFAL